MVAEVALEHQVRPAPVAADDAHVVHRAAFVVRQSAAEPPVHPRTVPNVDRPGSSNSPSGHAGDIRNLRRR